MLTLQKNLKEISKYNGFSSVGVTKPEIVDVDLKRRLENYLKNNWHADMKWLEKRVNERA